MKIVIFLLWIILLAINSFLLYPFKHFWFASFFFFKKEDTMNNCNCINISCYYLALALHIAQLQWYSNTSRIEPMVNYKHSHSPFLTVSTVFCFVLFCFVLFCFVLFCFVLFCFVLFCFVLFCFILFCFALLCLALLGFVLFCFVFVVYLLSATTLVPAESVLNRYFAPIDFHLWKACQSALKSVASIFSSFGMLFQMEYELQQQKVTIS